MAWVFTDGLLEGPLKDFAESNKQHSGPADWKFREHGFGLSVRLCHFIFTPAGSVLLRPFRLLKIALILDLFLLGICF